ncbi:putative NBD/HSP70 family sugar kinase [Phytomonospora endophytica]|uniref:Putative NBD/HSP70 family sugar kinase n=1 Tax=Phytomonospora endophytica TaxID=714109 RepID=A0A841FQ41_9ACTN|nr:putative NBD/HSP70 family sugar kinase [Phytomonospora endophytica]GIG68016.1 sugar kinase [Phytomonospora endophytica]
MSAPGLRAGPSQEEIRRHNLGALLRYVHINGATTRAELTGELGLNRSTIGALTADLATAGLVTEETPRASGAARAGRPSLVVRPMSALVYTYAVSVDVDRIRAARVGLGGEILDRREAARDGDTSVSETVAAVAAFVGQMHPDAPPDAVNMGTGVAVTGTARTDGGLVQLGGDIERFAEPLAEALSAVLGGDPRISVGKVADLSALAEHSRGVAAGCGDVVYLYGDVGVGAGIISGGHRVTSHGGYGGEVGHMVVRPGGHPCGCGSRGCWVTEIGEHALLSAAGRDGASGRDALLAVIDAAGRGDGKAQAAVRQVGDWLGFGVANLANILNPRMVVFGGTMRDLYLATAASLRSRVNAMVLPACRENLRLRTPKLGDDAALIGAAELAFERLLADPLADPVDGQGGD